MDNRTKEFLQEGCEVISRAADDTTYILMDSNSLTELTEDGLENKWLQNEKRQ